MLPGEAQRTGKVSASKRPRTKRAAARPPKSLEAAIDMAMMPEVISLRLRGVKLEDAYGPNLPQMVTLMATTLPAGNRCMVKSAGNSEVRLPKKIREPHPENGQT